MSKQIWKTGDVITAEKLNNIENHFIEPIIVDYEGKTLKAPPFEELCEMLKNPIGVLPIFVFRSSIGIEEGDDNSFMYLTCNAYGTRTMLENSDEVFTGFSLIFEEDLYMTVLRDGTAKWIISSGSHTDNYNWKYDSETSTYVFTDLTSEALEEGAN